MGWVILHKDGTVASFKARRAEFFGAVVENEPFTAGEVAYMDREWPGLAPHHIVALQAASADAITSEHVGAKGDV